MCVCVYVYVCVHACVRVCMCVRMCICLLNTYCAILFSGQSCSSEESVDAHAVSGAADHVPMLSNSHNQLPHVPMYTAMDYERTLQ